MVACSSSGLPREFQTLREYILGDLRRIVQMDVGGNYAVALLVTTACEALGSTVFPDSGGGAKFFTKYLLPEPWQEVGGTIFHALRNGLAHRFDTKGIIVFDGRRIEIGVSWREKMHLSYDAGSNCVWLRAQELVDSLDQAFSRLAVELTNEAGLVEKFNKFVRRQGEVFVYTQKEKEYWRKLLQNVASSGA